MTQTSDEVPNLIIGQRIIMAPSGGNFSDVTQSLRDKKKNALKHFFGKTRT